MMEIKVQKASKVLTIEQLDQREIEKRRELVEQLLSFLLRDDHAKFVQVEVLLP